MKHLITLCLTLFFMAGTQNAQAQTKEETIAWIKEKLEKSLIGYRYFQQENTEYWYPTEKMTVVLESICECNFVIRHGNTKITFPTNIKRIADVYENVKLDGKPYLPFFSFKYSAEVVLDSNEEFYRDSYKWISIEERGKSARTFRKSIKTLGNLLRKKERNILTIKTNIL